MSSGQVITPASFESVVAQTIPLLENAFTHIIRLQAHPDDYLGNFGIDYMGSKAQITACMGWRLLRHETAVDYTGVNPASDPDGILAELTAMGQSLIESVPSPATYDHLTFISEIGVLCRELRRYVQA